MTSTTSLTEQHVHGAIRRPTGTACKTPSPLRQTYFLPRLLEPERLSSFSKVLPQAASAFRRALFAPLARLGAFWPKKLFSKMPSKMIYLFVRFYKNTPLSDGAVEGSQGGSCEGFPRTGPFRFVAPTFKDHQK